MTSPYKSHLRTFLDLDDRVTVDRANAPSVTGKVTAVEDDACTIQGKGDDMGTVRNYFIAYDDIRGVSSLEHDLN